VIVDGGRSARCIVTGDPVDEHVLEFTLGEESSLDSGPRARADDEITARPELDA